MRRPLVAHISPDSPSEIRVGNPPRYSTAASHRKSRINFTISALRARIAAKSCRLTAFFRRHEAKSSPSFGGAVRRLPPTWLPLFGLSPNAVRQQLVVLERDGLVEEKSVRRGPTKPTLEFSLTSEADKLFPQQYDKMLAAVLREVKEKYGRPAVDKIFDGIARTRRGQDDAGK